MHVTVYSNSVGQAHARASTTQTIIIIVILFSSTVCVCVCAYFFQEVRGENALKLKGPNVEKIIYKISSNRPGFFAANFITSLTIVFYS